MTTVILATAHKTGMGRLDSVVLHRLQAVLWAQGTHAYEVSCV